MDYNERVKAKRAKIDQMYGISIISAIAHTM